MEGVPCPHDARQQMGVFSAADHSMAAAARQRKSSAGGRLARCEPPSVGRVTAAGWGIVAVIVLEARRMGLVEVNVQLVARLCAVRPARRR